MPSSQQLEPAMRLIGRRHRVGLGVRQALAIVIDELPDPARSRVSARRRSDEYRRERLSTRWTTWRERMPCNESLMIARVFRVQSQTGGDLARILDQLADTIKDRRQVHRKISILTAEGRMSAWVLMLIPLGSRLFIMSTQPDMSNALLYTWHRTHRPADHRYLGVLALFLAEETAAGERLMGAALSSVPRFRRSSRSYLSPRALADSVEERAHRAARCVEVARAGSAAIRSSRRSSTASSEASDARCLRKQLIEAGWYTTTPAEIFAMRVVARRRFGFVISALGMEVSHTSRLSGCCPLLAVFTVRSVDTSPFLRPRIGRSKRAKPRSSEDFAGVFGHGLVHGASGPRAQLRAGLCCRSAPGPLGDEISEALSEIRLGRARAEALKAVGERTNHPASSERAARDDAS